MRSEALRWSGSDVLARDDSIQESDHPTRVFIGELEAHPRGSGLPPADPGHAGSKLHDVVLANREQDILPETERFVEHAGTPAEAEVHHRAGHARSTTQHVRSNEEVHLEALVGAKVPHGH